MTSSVTYGSLESLLSKKSVGRTLPQYLDIELTERCNNSCIHCSINLAQDDTHALKRELKTSVLLQLIDQAAKAGVMHIRFTGGEPLLRADFSDIYRHTRKAGISVTIATNARLMTQDIADLLTRIPPREPIEISVYGICRRSYEAVTKAKGSFDEFMRGVNLLKDRGLKMSFAHVILPPNRKEADRFNEWLKTIAPEAPPPHIICDLHLRLRRDSESKNTIIRSLRMNPGEVPGILRKLDSAYIGESKEFCRHFLHKPDEKLFSCQILDSGCIDPYGILRPCLFVLHPDFLIDLTQVTLREGLSALREKLLERKSGSCGYQKRCAKCFLRNLCDHCPGRSWSEHGTLDTPVDYACEMAHAEMRALGLLQVGEEAWKVTDWPERLKTIKQP